MHSLDIVARTPGDPSPLDDSPVQAREQADLYALALSTLRGRILLAVILGLIGAAGGAWVGWQHGVKTFKSEGQIQISSPGLQPQGGLQGSEVFLRSQAQQIATEAVVNSALQQDDWKATGRGDSQTVKNDFMQKLKVDVAPKTQDTLLVSYESADAKVSTAAVRAVIAAYEAYHDSDVKSWEDKRLKTVDERIAAAQHRMDDVDAQIGSAMQDATVFDAQSLSAARINRMQLQTSLDAVTIQIAKLKTKADAAGVGEAPAPRETPEELAMHNPALRDLLERRSQLQSQLKVDIDNKPAMSPDIRRDNANIALLDLEIARQQDAILNDAQLPSAPANPQQPMVSANLIALQAEEAAQTANLKKADTEVQRLEAAQVQANTAQLKLTTLRGQQGQIQQELDSLANRRDQVITDPEFMNVVVVRSRPEVPIFPFRDNRIKFAAVGGMGGMMLPLGLLIFFGFINRKYRYADEMTRDLGGQGGPALLGVLPVVSAGTPHLERSADAAQAVHQVRVLLQMGRRQGAKVFLVSSASPGEGKTSLTVGLGLSFMASGARTLLIDCDLVGQNLTRGFGAGGEKGLHEAIGGGAALNTYVRPIRPGLSLLPVGRAQAADACAISPQGLQPVLAAARELYDIVLVDSGPLLGSVEASVLATQVDQVVMTISRGQQPALLERTFAQLRTLGASVAGCVFNRAGMRDYMQSAPHASLRSVSAGPLVPTAPRQQSRFGPLVESIMMFMPTTEET